MTYKAVEKKAYFIELTSMERSFEVFAVSMPGLDWMVMVFVDQNDGEDTELVGWDTLTEITEEGVRGSVMRLWKVKLGEAR